MPVTQIKQSELNSWEDKFKKDVYPSVQFFKQPLESGKEIEDTDGVTMQLYAGESGIDASWYGKILLENDNFLYFELSLQKPPFIKAEMVINEQTSEVVKNLYLYYISWKQYWLDALSGDNSADMVSEIRKNRNSKFIIENYSQRMRILAGVKRIK
jgi:hypothetical protein